MTKNRRCLGEKGRAEAGSLWLILGADELDLATINLLISIKFHGLRLLFLSNATLLKNGY